MKKRLTKKKHGILNLQQILAPNAYEVTASDEAINSSAPKFSFGLKTEIIKPEETPG